jgi:uncharacterized protein
METGTVKRIDPIAIISKYYETGSTAYMILVEHSGAVAQKSIEVARRISYGRPDIEFVEEAAMLHDIGIFMTNVPDIGCHGDKPYICHGYIGRELLEKEGLPKHALVCERHVGVGITVEDIERAGLPLPRRDMLPLTIEEKIICYADKFFSKRPDSLGKENLLEEVRNHIARYGRDKLKSFDRMSVLFNM